MMRRPNLDNRVVADDGCRREQRNPGKHSRQSFELAVSERMILAWRFEGDLKTGPGNEGWKNIAGWLDAVGDECIRIADQPDADFDEHQCDIDANGKNAET
jgi:hypothetical protein